MDKLKQIKKKRYQKWISMIEKPEGLETKEKFAKSIGITAKTLIQWEKHPTFWKDVKEYSDREIPKLSDMVRKKHLEMILEKGDTAAIKLFYQKLEGWSERIEQNLSVELKADEIAEIADKVKDKLESE